MPAVISVTCNCKQEAAVESKKKVLIVDDEEVILFLYKEELEEEGFAVETAMNGELALRQFEAAPPDLVILDINMPGMNGIEVLRQMKSLNAQLPVILSSAYPEYKQDFGAWASDEYIVKSANTADLKAAVRKYLD
ncbi:response regulator [Desulfobulbus sp. F5]|jgi:DNA-binding response OmpR family regulator|nr:response regulator [Desulfobulbus sp. F5]